MLAERLRHAGRELWRPERRFWLIVGVITLGGAGLRLLVHDQGLPGPTRTGTKSRSGRWCSGSAA